MLSLASDDAFLRSKAPVLAAFIVFISSVALSQDSFMGHYTQSGPGADVVNRGDFNNDGIPDIITANNGGNGGYAVSVNLGKGDGRFQNPLNSNLGMGAFDIAIGDFNADGKLDVAVAGYTGSGTGVIQILLGKGDGTFTIGQKIFLSGAATITAADFDGDGKLDLAVGASGPNKVYFYKGSGTGTFTSIGSKTVGTNGVLKVRVGDFDGDGKPDIALSEFGALYVLWNTGNFTFSVTTIGTEANGIVGIPVDVNQDHYTDLVVSYSTCSNPKGSACPNWEVLLGQPNETFKKSASMTLGSAYETFSGQTAVDVNGDGINDIVGLTGYSELLIWLGNPDGSYQSTPLVFFLGSDSSASDLVASDFNRDGKIDFATPTPGGPSSIGLEILLNATPRATCTPNQVSPSVTVCEPQDLAYLNSPVQWIADSRDTSHPVTAMQIYVDNKLVVNSPSSSLNEPLSLTKGTHFVVTKAWDKSGANFRSDRNITIYSGTPGETCPAAPSSITVCSPTQNQVTTTSLHVFANADSAVNQITAVQVYIDGKLIYNDTTGATYVDTTFTVAKGSHLIVVKGWDADGNVHTESRNISAQ